MRLSRKLAITLAFMTCIVPPAFASSYVFTDLPNNPLSPTNESVAFGINNSGAVAGFYSDPTGLHGFVFSGGSYAGIDYPGVTGNTTLAGINDSGGLAGTYCTLRCYAFSDVAGIFTTVVDPIGTALATGAGINNSGAVSGYYFDEFFAPHGFVDNAGVFTTIDDPFSDRRNPSKWHQRFWCHYGLLL